MLTLPILEIKQPLGVFYAVKINAKDLLKISDSDPYRVSEELKFRGIQRPIQEKRLKEIEVKKTYEQKKKESVENKKIELSKQKRAQNLYIKTYN
jgi:transposase-like protein